MKNKFPDDRAKYKLIVSDFDGTLARSDHSLSKKNIDAVKKWEASGRNFTIATGRQFAMIKDECKTMGIKAPVVTRGGAEVIDPATGKILFFEYINIEDVQKINALAPIDEVNWCIEEGNVLFANYRLMLDFDGVVYKPLTDFSSRSIPKFHFKPRLGEEEKAAKFADFISEKFPKLNVIRTHSKQFGPGWDVTSAKATKLHGIVNILKTLNIKRDLTVGVGDSYNDFPLLEAAALKVGMGNAHDELKEIADIIVPTNDEDGVAHLINMLLEK